jgi:ribosomal protein S27AE
MLAAMGKHRLEDKRAPKEPRRTAGFLSTLRNRNNTDDLFERSFRFCTRCGDEVYVLANDCRNCGDARSLTPAPAL